MISSCEIFPHVTLTYKLDLDTVKMNHQLPNIMQMDAVISFETSCGHNTHTADRSLCTGR